MNRQKKPFKFYLIVFLLSALIIAAYSLYMILIKDTPVEEVYTLWFMPPFFVFFYWGSDAIILKITNRKKKVDYEAKFLETISEKMRDSEEFLVEDFRRLQINVKFQEDLKKAYLIYKNGEDEVFNIKKLENKYRKNTIEKRAMKFVVDYLKEKKELPEIE